MRSEPRSPVERLKDTVNKMCLYTGSPRGSDSTSPHPSPRKRSSLTDVVDVVIKTRTGTAKTLDLGEHVDSKVDYTLIADCGITDETMTDPDAHQRESNDLVGMLDSKQTDNVEIGENCVQQTDFYDSPPPSVRTSLDCSLSREPVITTDLLPSRRLKDSRLTESVTRTAEINPAARVTYDLIRPQIIESAHQASFLYRNTHRTNSLLRISSVSESTDRCPESHKAWTRILTCEPNEDSQKCNAAAPSGKASQVDALGSLPVKGPGGSFAHCCITVTGWEGEDVSVNPAPVTSMPTPEEAFKEEERRFLNPPTHLGSAKISSNPKVNSFELEEV